MRYRDAGVDVAAGDSIKQALGRQVRGTWGPSVRRLPGGFAGVIEWPGGGALLAASMDGVGTKLHLAIQAGRVADAAGDLVHHGANDVLCHGARPVAFLDYIAQARLQPELIEAVVEGLARACAREGCALLGGETAQMPDTYLPGVVDVAGCMIGAVRPGELRDGSSVRPGDALVGLASDGLHTNGFSLARRVLERSGLELDSPLPGGSGESVAEALLARHRSYVAAVSPLLPGSTLHAPAHVTGGGVHGNLVRVLPEDARAAVRASAWPWPPVFRWLAEAGDIPLEEMRDTFNLGVGMILVVDGSAGGEIVESLQRAGERAFVMGEVIAGPRGVDWVEG
jgi:phosphoribosylformylglycinamidine cyclo-ligase